MFWLRNKIIFDYTLLSKGLSIDHKLYNDLVLFEICIYEVKGMCVEERWGYQLGRWLFFVADLDSFLDQL